VAVLHHSNLGRYRRTAPIRDVISLAEHLLPVQREFLRRVTIARWDNHRGRSMTAKKFAQMAADVGLACSDQEIIAWVSPLLIDCISVVTRPGPRWERPNVVVTNRQFPNAARSAAAIARAVPAG
jgi:hypothetical protein